VAFIGLWQLAEVAEEGRRRWPVGFNGEAFSSFESAPKGGEMVVRRFQERRGELDRVAWHASASSGGATWLRCGYDD
jgi:hypothetical protein